MAIPHTPSRVERALFWLACRLASLVVRAADRLDRPGATIVDVVRARTTLEFVSAVGWVVDRLPLGETRLHRSSQTDCVHPPFDSTRSNGHIQSTH